VVTDRLLRAGYRLVGPILRGMPVEFFTDDEAAEYGRYAGVASQAELEKIFFLDFSEHGGVSDGAELGDYVVDMCVTLGLGWSERGAARRGERVRELAGEDAGGDTGSGGVLPWADVAAA
jgi:hypothetical protein